MKKLSLFLCLLTIPLSLFAPAKIVYDDSRLWNHPIISNAQHLQAQIDIRVFYLKKTLDEMVRLDCYKRHNGMTFCNIGSQDALDDRTPFKDKRYGFMLDDLHLDLRFVFPYATTHYYTNISTTYKIVKEAVRKGRVSRVSMHQAWELAKIGEVVWVISSKYNHEAIVYPDARPWDENRGCTIANVGRWNRITDISHITTFGRWYKDPEIMFVWVRRCL